MSETSDQPRIRVAFCSQPEYFRFMYERDLDAFADVMELKIHFGMNIQDYQSLIDFQPDYTFFFRGETVPRQVIEQVKGIKIALSSEPFPRYVNGHREQTTDSMQRYDVFRPIRFLPFDYVFHYDAASLLFFKEDGLHLSGHFPFPVATGSYYPKPTTHAWDVFFIGRSTIHREQYFGALKHHKKFLHICHGIWGPALVEYMHASKICLNVHAENEVSWEPRMQMMLSCGAFVISEKITPNPQLRPGIDYVQVDNPQQMYDAVEHYTVDNAAREKIAMSGAARVRELLDARTNFSELIAGIDAGIFERFHVGAPSIAVTLTHKSISTLSKFKSLLRG